MVYVLDVALIFSLNEVYMRSSSSFFFV